MQAINIPTKSSVHKEPEMQAPLSRKLTLKKRKLFLQLLGELGNVSRAAAIVGTSREVCYRLRKTDPAFAAAWAKALDLAVSKFEDIVAERAFRGQEQPIFYKGRVVGHKREPSDLLAMFYIKAHRPQYRDRQEAPPAGPLTIELVLPEGFRATREVEAIDLEVQGAGQVDRCSPSQAMLPPPATGFTKGHS